ncbi:hypothetical protein AB1E18_016400 [Capra hircus]
MESNRRQVQAHKRRDSPARDPKRAGLRVDGLTCQMQSEPWESVTGFLAALWKGASTTWKGRGWEVSTALGDPGPPKEHLSATEAAARRRESHPSGGGRGRGARGRQAAPSLRRRRRLPPAPPAPAAGLRRPLRPRRSQHFANSSPARGGRSSAPCALRRGRGAAGGAEAPGAGAGGGGSRAPRRGRAGPRAPRPPGRAPRRAAPRRAAVPAAQPRPRRRRPAARAPEAGTMASAAEPPGQAAEYLQELTRIVAAQQELLARRRRRIEELERQVARLSRENAGLLERHRRHLAACARRPDPGPGPPPLGAAPELGGHRDKSEGESSRSIRTAALRPQLRGLEEDEGASVGTSPELGGLGSVIGGHTTSPCLLLTCRKG